jgi:hypothetical protein
MREAYSDAVGQPGPDDAAGWRQLAEQLQAALQSRIVIEQAKGVLRERLGLPIDLSFELLRTAARRRRMKLHALAAEVVESFSTPDAIVEELASQPDRYPGAPTEERAFETEELARRVNDATAERSADDSRVYICECANPYCTETLEVDADEIEALHSRPGYYLVLPGHQVPEFESTVITSSEFHVVHKHDDVRSTPA